MVMYFQTAGVQGRSSGTARAMGGNSLTTSMSIRRDKSAWEGKKSNNPKKPKKGRAKPTPKQHPLGDTFTKRKG